MRMSRTTKPTSVLHRWLMAVLVVLGITAGSVAVVTPASAAPLPQAASLTAASKPCAQGGQFVNLSNGVGIGGITNWTSSSSVVYNNQGWNFIVSSGGQSSKNYRCDTDGFYVGPGYCAKKQYRITWPPAQAGQLSSGVVYRGGNSGVSVKIGDLETWYVTAYRC